MARKAADVPRLSMDGERLIALMRQLVPVIGSALPPDSCVSLHDLTLFPETLILRHGDRLDDHLTKSELDDLIGLDDQSGLETHTDRTRTITMVVHDTAHSPVAALRIISDLSRWHAAREFVNTFLRDDTGNGDTLPPLQSASNVRSVDAADPLPHVADLATQLIDEAIGIVDVPVELMRKEHKLRVVERLQAHGIFQLRDSIETVASALHVTRFTVYNYLNELEDAPTTGAVKSSSTGTRK